MSAALALVIAGALTWVAKVVPVAIGGDGHRSATGASFGDHLGSALLAALAARSLCSTAGEGAVGLVALGLSTAVVATVMVCRRSVPLALVAGGGTVVVTSALGV